MLRMGFISFFLLLFDLGHFIVLKTECILYLLLTILPPKARALGVTIFYLPAEPCPSKVKVTVFCVFTGF